MMQKKSFFKNHISNLLTAVLFSVLNWMFFSCSGMAVYFGDGADVKEELKKVHTTEYTFYLENPVKNPNSEKIAERFQIGANVTPDTIQGLEMKPGYVATGWIFFDPDDDAAQVPANVHIDTENKTNSVTSVSVTLNPLNFYAKGWVRADKSTYHVRYMLQKVSKQKLSESDTEITSGGTTYYLSYLVGKDLTRTGFADELTEAAFATSDLISGIDNYTLVTTEIEQQIIKEDNSTAVEIYYDLKPITVTLNPGSGSGDTITQTFYAGTDCITIQPLETTGFSKEGSIFALWNTNSDGSGESYSDSAAISFASVPAEPVTLYAQWIKDAGDAEITITFPDFTDETLSLTGVPQTVTKGTQVTITIGGSHTLFKWFINGSETGGDSTLTWTPSESGIYQILCVVDGKYSASVEITVTGTVGS